MTTPHGEDRIHGEDEFIIEHMDKVRAQLDERLSHIRNSSDTSGIDPAMAAVLHQRMEDGHTHLTRGLGTAEANITAARNRMDAAGAYGSAIDGADKSISTSLSSGGSSPAASALAGHTPSFSDHTPATPKSVGPTPIVNPNYTVTHTTGGSATGYTPVAGAPAGATAPVRPPATAYAPSTVQVPSTQQQAHQWYQDAIAARKQLEAQPNKVYDQAAARNYAALQHRAHNTHAADLDRAQRYAQAVREREQQAAQIRDQQAQQREQRLEQAREQQKQAAELLRSQTAQENRSYDDMLKDMESRTESDLPQRVERDAITPSPVVSGGYDDMVPTLFDSADDAEVLEPRDAYNDRLRDYYADRDVDTHDSNQSAAELAQNKAELQERIYQMLKEEDAYRESNAQAFGSAPGIAGGYPTGTVMPLTGSVDDQAVIDLANQYVAANIPYAWGGGHGATPGPSQGVSDGGGYADMCGDYNKIGLDCSGLARDFTWNMYGVDINGTAATQYASGMPVPPEHARPGDIFFPSSAGRPPGHVTVYVGNNTMLEAQQSGTLIMFSPLSAGEFRRFVQ